MPPHALPLIQFTRFTTFAALFPVLLHPTAVALLSCTHLPVQVCSIHAIMNQATDLGNLTKGRETRAITVRVIRKWTVREDGDDGPPRFIGVVLADAKVTRGQTHTYIYCLLLRKKGPIITTGYPA